MMRGIKLCFSPKFSEVTFNYSAEYFSLDGADSKVSLSPYMQGGGGGARCYPYFKKNQKKYVKIDFLVFYDL